MRPVMRVDTPPAYPHVCIICGHGAGPYRRFFIDLGFDIAGRYQPIHEGAVYLCDQCVTNVLDAILQILAEDRRATMNNSLQKEEASYGIMDGITGGSSLSDVSSGESSGNFSGTRTDRGTFSKLDQGENLPDSGVGSSSEIANGVADAADRNATPVDPGEADSRLIPTFRMGRRIS